MRARCRNTRHLSNLYSWHLLYPSCVCVWAAALCAATAAISIVLIDQQNRWTRKKNERNSVWGSNESFLCESDIPFYTEYTFQTIHSYSGSMRRSDNNKRRELSIDTHTYTSEAEKNLHTGTNRRQWNCTHTHNRTHGAYSVLWL